MSRQTSGSPAPDTVAIATGRHRPIMVVEPETMEPKKKISIPTAKTGIPIVVSPLSIFKNVHNSKPKLYMH